MPAGSIFINGDEYPIAHDSQLPKGERALSRELRDSQRSDPGRIRQATWKPSGRMGLSREGPDGFLGQHYSENLSTFVDGLLTSTGERNTLSLGSSSALQYGLPTSDVVKGNWTEFAGDANANAFEELDEGFGAGRGSGSGPDDDITAWESGAGPVADELREALGSITDPAIHTNHKFRARLRQANVTPAAPSFETVSTVTDVAVESITIDKPSGAAENDLLIAIVATDPSRSITPPSGWTEIDQGDAPAPAIRLGVWYKVAGASEPPSYSFSWTSLAEVAAAIMRYSGVDITNPIDVSGADTGTSTTPTAPSVTTTIDDTMVVRIAAIPNTQTFTPPAGNTERFDFGVGGTEPSISAADKTEATAGVIAAAAFTVSTSVAWRAVTVALTPLASEAVDATIRLYQGTTVIASVTQTDVSVTYLTVERTLTEGEAANITDYTDLKIGVIADRQDAVVNIKLRCSAVEFECPDSDIANVIAMDEDRGQLFFHRGPDSVQVDPSDMSVVESITHAATVLDAAVWNGKGYLPLGQGNALQRRVTVTPTASTYEDVQIDAVDVEAKAIVVGPKRVWWVDALSASENKLRFSLDAFVTQSPAFLVGDEGVPATRLGTWGRVIIAGSETGAFSFDDETGDPVRVLEAVKNHRSPNNGVAQETAFGWHYIGTDLGLYATVPGQIENSAGIETDALFTGPIDGRTTAVLYYLDRFYAAVLTSDGDTFINAGLFGRRTPVSGRPDWYSMFKLENTEVHVLRATGQRTNPTLIWSEDEDIAYGQVGRRNIPFGTGGGDWFGTTMTRDPGMLKNLRTARFKTANCNGTNTWQFRWSNDSGDFADIGSAVTTNGMQVIRPVSAGVPLTTVSFDEGAPSFQQVAADTDNPPEVVGNVVIDYDERPDQVEAVQVVLLLGQEDAEPETEFDALSTLAGASQASPFTFRLPFDQDDTYGFIQAVEENRDIETDEEGNTIPGVTVTLLLWETS